MAARAQTAPVELLSRARWILVGAIVVVLVAALLVNRRGRVGHGHQEFRCPAHAQSDGARTQRLFSLLRTIDEARTSLGLLRAEPLICYSASSESALQSNGAIVLSSVAEDRANAARLMHLLSHYPERFIFEDSAIRGSPDTCHEIVERLMVAERRALGVENRVRSALGLDASLGSLSALQQAYLKRCERLRSGDAASP